MFSHWSPAPPTSALLLALLGTLGVSIAGCGSLGPSQHSENADQLATPFHGTECEPGLVFECEPLCMRGDMLACETSGLGYLSGAVVSQDLERARILLDRACAAGHVLACSGWAKMAEDDQGVRLKDSRIDALLSLGCDRGDTNACLRIGKRLLARATTEGVPEAQAKAQSKPAHEYLDKACSAGELAGCFELGLSAETGRAGYPKDLTASMRWLNEACAGDIGAACYEVATLQGTAGSPFADAARARQNMDKACTLKSGAACAYLANVFESGLGVPKNIARARELHETACTLEQHPSCLALGRLLVDTDPNSALDWYARACRAGLSAACLAEGKLLEGRTVGLSTDADSLRTAAQRYASACSGGLAEACAYGALRRINDAGGTDQIPREERPTVAQALERGCNETRIDDACLVYGSWLAQGEAGMAQDGAKAARLLGPLCGRAEQEARFAAACQHLGRLSENGVGLERNVFGAASFYEKGCSAGYAPSCLSHAHLLWRGTNGYKKDPEAAVVVFRRQCDDNSADACVSLGYAQLTGVGTARNLAEAKSRFERACDQDLQSGCAHLGYYYLSTRGSEDDRKKGEQLLQTACDSANGEGCFFLAETTKPTKTRKQELLKRACLLQVTDACLALKASVR